MVAYHYISPSTQIKDVSGFDWTWAFVVFREVPGFPGYAAGSNGAIWSSRRGRWRLLRPCLHKDGHLWYVLYRDGTHCRKFGHQIVLEAFIGPCPIGMETCHGDGDPANNSLWNLRYDTKKANSEDSIRHGTRPKGEIHGRAKICESDVLMIRRLGAEGWTLASIGRRFGVSPQQVRRIVKGKHWGHVRLELLRDEGRPT